VKFLVIKLRDGAEPVRVSARMCATPQLMFTRDEIRQLEELNPVHKNSGAESASPQLILMESGPEQYRVKVDLHVLSTSTKPTAWPMPNSQDELHDFHRSEPFCDAEFLSRLLADTFAQRLSRLSVYCHAGWFIQIDACTA
jgi:hypothetical protein